MPPADDDPGWIRCECGEEVPLTTQGHPYPHDCKGCKQ